MRNVKNGNPGGQSGDLWNESSMRRNHNHGGLFSLTVITVVALAASITARADVVTDWNEIASQAIATASAASRPGPATALDFAIVHVAIHDAVQAFENRFKRYHVHVPGAYGSPVAAVAKAAHDVLLSRFPSQAASLDATYNSYLSANGLLPSNPGIAVGQMAAAGIIALRQNDGSFPSNPEIFVGGTDPGEWRPTISYQPGPPPSNAPMAAPWLGSVTPFTLKSPRQFRPFAPPGLRSRSYEREYNEVKALGSLMNSSRTPAQTALSYFWADNFLVQWNRCLRSIAAQHLTSIGDSARLFALANMAIADAMITTWDSKKHFNFWRPVTAIQLGDTDGNPRTIGDANWQPFLNTPNYPEYTSGANVITGAVTVTLALFFRTDRMNFTVTSTHPLANPNSRKYSRFSDPADEVVNVRIYQGIHFRSADVVARIQGSLVALWAFTRYLRPIGGHHR
jgi:hypothetical protein